MKWQACVYYIIRRGGHTKGSKGELITPIINKRKNIYTAVFSHIYIQQSAYMSALGIHKLQRLKLRRVTQVEGEQHVCVTSSGKANIMIRNIRGSLPHPIINKEDITQC